MTELRPDDRLLVVSPGPEVPLRRWAEQLSTGLMVVIGESDAVYALRRELREYTNVMIVAGDTDGTIPWRDGFFSVVWAPGPTPPASEVRRVLEAEGRLITAMQ